MPTIKENLTETNYTPRGTSPSWIVVHNTSNGTATPPIAYNNTCYFKSEYRGASASYFIDDGDTIWQCVRDRDTAWHCGEAPSRNGCYNSNSIGIEVCEQSDGTFTLNEINNLTWLVQRLMKEFGIPASRVCRHHDVTGKECPWYYSNDSRWAVLKKQITEGEMLTKEDANVIWGFDNWGDQKGTSGNAWCNLMDTNRRVQSVETKQAAMDKKLDKIIKKLGA